MTQGNVAIVRAVYEAFREGNLDELRGMTTPDFVLRASSATDGKEHHGPDAMGEVIQAIRDRWEDFRVQPLEFYEAGNCVLVLGTILTKARGDKGLASTAGQVWTLDEGKIASMDAFLDSDSAIRAAGFTHLLA